MTLAEIRTRATAITGLPFEWSGDHQLGECLRESSAWLLRFDDREDDADELYEMSNEADAIYHGPDDDERCSGCGYVPTASGCRCDDDHEREAAHYDGEGKDWR